MCKSNKESVEQGRVGSVESIHQLFSASLLPLFLIRIHFKCSTAILNHPRLFLTIQFCLGGLLFENISKAYPPPVFYCIGRLLSQVGTYPTDLPNGLLLKVDTIC
ncbi:hypothetical protein AMTRI_Chr08g163450 [Amborella trichopoda]